ncbi:hypothetical protein [Aneurinibacillus aneurinilyticus]|uniref:hypothetical protein n=1 Tax=Aneurinibacillus aneurinilyticus TaxID=1391 RepID=UPI00197CB448|nr:hypothetical protein [Aneurinibacillus aneurinilyticus]
MMWWVSAIVIICLIAYAVFSKPVRKLRRTEDLVKGNGYSPAADPIHPPNSNSDNRMP